MANSLVDSGGFQKVYGLGSAIQGTIANHGTLVLEGYDAVSGQAV